MTFPFRIPPTKSQSNGVQILSASISGLDSSRDFMVDRLGICDQASATHWNESRVICRREEYETGSTATTRCVAYQRPFFPFLGSLRLQEVAAIDHSFAPELWANFYSQNHPHSPMSPKTSLDSAILVMANCKKPLCVCWTDVLLSGKMRASTHFDWHDRLWNHFWLCSDHPSAAIASST
jgi:hypothetical protein